MDIKKLEDQYLEAKKAYYDGNPIMSDADFDILENILNENNSIITKTVGTVKAGKFDHPSPMLSLGKISVYDNENLPIGEISKWMTGSEEYEITPKLDGNAINLIYEKGTLNLALTRGSGLKGFDMTSKLIHMVPNFISTPFEKVEIRGEVVLPVETFNKKYSEFKNPRNFVAGVLGRDETNPIMIKDFKFIAFELKAYTGNVYEYPDKSTELLSNLGFEVPFRKVIRSSKEFSSVYSEFLDFRENHSKYQLDGMVIKMKESDRADVGYTDHHPKWAIAIKFPPKEAITTIVGISWKTGTSGEIVPTAVMEPIDLDGTTVSRATLFNWGKVKEMKAFPGAKVLIAKAGDIIPQIYQVITPSENPIEHPKTCPSCAGETRLDGVHIWCDNNECYTRVISKLEAGIRTFKIENIGSSTIKKFHEVGFKTVKDVFDFSKFNEEALIKTGEFKKGRSLEIIMDGITSVKEVTISQALMACQFESLGWSTAQQIGKYLSGIEYDFKGLNREVVKSITDENHQNRKFLNDFINILSNSGITVTYEISAPIDNNIIKYEMTGSPKDSGYPVKSEFIKFLTDKGYQHHKLDSDCQLLITDSYDSSSSKMSAARKKGIEIITYSDLINKLN
jgi:DNA ligase (NAD+)